MGLAFFGGPTQPTQDTGAFGTVNRPKALFAEFGKGWPIGTDEKGPLVMPIGVADEPIGFLDRAHEFIKTLTKWMDRRDALPLDGTGGQMDHDVEIRQGACVFTEQGKRGTRPILIRIEQPIALLAGVLLKM